MDKVCGNCAYYMGGGDWNLCCMIQHPTPSEQKAGATYPFGHLCYEDTVACDMFEEKLDNHN